jgi:hypothetical protein
MDDQRQKLGDWCGGQGEFGRASRPLSTGWMVAHTSRRPPSVISCSTTLTTGNQTRGAKSDERESS